MWFGLWWARPLLTSPQLPNEGQAVHHRAPENHRALRPLRAPAGPPALGGMQATAAGYRGGCVCLGDRVMLSASERVGDRWVEVWVSEN